MSQSQPRHAMEIVLGVPELLESILVQVDIKTLLISASRVSKTWKTMIDGSPAIQKALFFKPGSMEMPRSVLYGLGDGALSDVLNTSVRRVLNPLLVEKFDKCFFDFGPTYSCHRRANSFYELPWSTQPEPVKVVQEYWGGWNQVRPSELDEESKRAQMESRNRFTRRGASWRRMLVSQPPPPALGYMRFDICNDVAEEQKVSSAQLKPSSETTFDGLRMGEFYDIVQHEAGHHGRHSLWFRVLWGNPIGVFAFTHVKGIFERLMAQTGVVVEFMHADDNSLPSHPQDPADTQVFDSAFRCKEYREVKIETEETWADVPEFPEFDPRQVVWHWRLEDDERAV